MAYPVRGDMRRWASVSAGRAPAKNALCFPRMRQVMSELHLFAPPSGFVSGLPNQSTLTSGYDLTGSL